MAQPAFPLTQRRVHLLLSFAFIVITYCLVFIINQVHGETNPLPLIEFSRGHYHDQIKKMQEFRSSLMRHELASSMYSSSLNYAPTPAPQVWNGHGQRVIEVTSCGADPTGKLDSTDAILKAIEAACNKTNTNKVSLIKGVTDLGGVHIHLQGGNYLVSKPLRLPTTGLGNLMISGGTLRASDDFPKDAYLIDLSSPPWSRSYNYEYISLKDLMVDCNYRGGGIQIIHSLRISIDNCYIAHFHTNGILVRSGHETYIRNSFLGQHITAGGDPGERNFSGTGINLTGNDNALTDVVIFSASTGVMVSGQANTLSGVHCYNKASTLGGTGIYVKLPGFTQTRIINSYMDYTSIVAEDPVQLSITNSFFLGDANIVLKSINGVATGVTIVDNMFSGRNKGVDIVKLNGPFNQIDQVVVDRNIVRGMNVKATVARASIQGNGTSWTVDFGPLLLFPNLVNHVQYSFFTTATAYHLFPRHALTNVSHNRVVIESDVAVHAKVFVTVHQGVTTS